MTITTTPTATDLPANDLLAAARLDPRPWFDRAIAVATPVIGAVRGEQLDGPTPCTEMDVRTLLGHLVAVVGRVTTIARRVPPISAPAMVTGVPDGGWEAAWRDATAEQRAAWAADDALLDEDVVFPWATWAGRDALLTYVAEVTVHTWDLATATGQQPAWDDDVARVALAHGRVILPPERRRSGHAAVRDQLPPELRDLVPPFDDVVPAPVDASPIEAVVAWYGRRPR